MSVTDKVMISISSDEKGHLHMYVSTEVFILRIDGQ